MKQCLVTTNCTFLPLRSRRIYTVTHYGFNLLPEGSQPYLLSTHITFINAWREHSFGAGIRRRCLMAAICWVGCIPGQHSRSLGGEKPYTSVGRAGAKQHSSTTGDAHHLWPCHRPCQVHRFNLGLGSAEQQEAHKSTADSQLRLVIPSRRMSVSVH